MKLATECGRYLFGRQSHSWSEFCPVRHRRPTLFGVLHYASRGTLANTAAPYPTLALGGDCLADVAVVRAEPGMFGVVASDPTVSRLITALAADAPKALAAVASARAQARSVAWASAGERAPDHDIEVTTSLFR